MLKAALNHAFRQGRVASDVAWRLVQPFRRVAAARVRRLRDDEAVRLADACAGDLRALVTGAPLTGCRYGEPGAVAAGDFDPAAAVHVARGKGGRARHAAPTDEGAAFFRRAAAEGR